MTYNRREIMKKAWSMFRAAKLFRTSQTFSDCLKLSWSDAKKMVAPPVEVARTVSAPATITARELRAGDIVTIEYGT
jgi:magnesium-transporting ATPase (P-type)